MFKYMENNVLGLLLNHYCSVKADKSFFEIFEI